MKKLIIALVLNLSVLIPSTGFATTINPNILNDFEDGLTHGWKKGASASERQLPIVKQESNGNHYLEVNSIGGGESGRGPSSRMTFINETEWRGNYNSAGVGSILVRMKNMGEDTLYMRAGFTTRTSDEWHFAGSKTPLELAADGQWYDLSFAISEEYITPFLGNEGECCFPEWSFEEVMAGVNQLKFHSGETAHFWGGERVDSLLAVDDIQISSDISQSVHLSQEFAPVPLPAANWLFITALLGMFNITRKKL